MTAGDEALRARYETALGNRDAPLAFVDLDALAHNARLMLDQAGALPVRLASKSVRCVDVLRRAFALGDGFRGVLAFTPAEALHLAGHGFEDLVIAYPSVDRRALAAVAQRAAEGAPGRIVAMVDSVEGAELVAVAARAAGVQLPVCLDLDAGFRTAGGRVRIGPKRSPLRTPEQAAAVAGAIGATDGVRIVGLMAYEGQIAGVGDRLAGRPLRSTAIRAMQAASLRELRDRLPRVVAAVRAVTGELEFVNGGGTGSLARTAAAGTVTELAAGSGLYAPTLFDTYRSLRLRAAAGFALPVVRRPGPRTVTVLGGGYLASGVAAADRAPTPWLPAGLTLDGDEGAGEVQTPLHGPAAATLKLGDRVLFRHAKAGELCERFATLLLVQGDRVVDEVPTYRGEGHTFL